MFLKIICDLEIVVYLDGENYPSILIFRVEFQTMQYTRFRLLMIHWVPLTTSTLMNKKSVCSRQVLVVTELSYIVVNEMMSI